MQETNTHNECLTDRQSGTRADFHMSYGGFSFIFFRDSVTENVTDNVTERKMPSHQIVLNLLKDNPMRSREEIKFRISLKQFLGQE